ncbi:MAG: hypothetical protein K0S47_2669 [Herbinix sp.]|jgi:hypothetical protein|nr:hypothetical protein [Herbinix sp.]
MDRNKELKLQYLQSKPDMGVYIIRSNTKKKCIIEKTKDLKGTLNGTLFKLNSGFYPNRELIKEWKEFGESEFTIEVLEKLKHKEEDAMIDYSEDLEIMQMLWIDKYKNENWEFYKR